MITRLRAVWLLAILVFVVPVFAQRKSKEPAGPRAVAVIEWTAQGMRLVPVSLMIDGKFYDATLYRANPVPMAVEQETVYEVQKAGDVTGDFTVTTPAQLPNGAWIGQGTFVSEEQRRKKEEERNKDTGPVLKRPGSGSSQAENPQDDRPVLRRGSPKSDTSSTSPAPPQNTPAAQQPEPSAQGAAQQTATATPPPTPELHETENAPDRPVLKRGKPAEEQAQSLGKDTLPHKVPPKPPAGISKMQVAVSDASTNDTHPYVWKWANHDEEVKFKDEAQKMALALVTGYAKQNNRPVPGKVEVTGFSAFDLAYNNEPQVVLTAKVLPAAAAPARRATAKSAAASPAAPSGFEYYVTLVATQDIYGQLQKMFSAISDNKHLDAFPRFELIDAVDADGDKNGDLLFRRISDLSSAFVLYKVIGTRVEELIRVPEPKETSAGS